jgi:N-methylhydantoinase A
MLIVGIDVGGTFTDLVLFDATTGRLAVTKTSSTANQADGVVDALRRLDVETRDVDRMVHGTTVATNAIVQRRGVPVALVTTAGFRDVLEVGQTRRRVPDTMFQPAFRRPEPLVPRPLRLEVRERTRHTGAVLEPVDEAELVRLAEDLRGAGVEAVAVCFLHAYASDANERRATEVLGTHLPGAFVTHSAEVVPEHREFERFSTTVINAYVSPVLARYLTRLASRLGADGLAGPLYTMSSSGGAMTVEQASRLGVKTILSGPVGGVQATVFVAEAARLRDVISYDMGGTSTDVALIHDRAPALSTDNVVDSFPVRTPQVDINSVGAGGGSIAWLDRSGALNVGPTSAGALPGPACYDRGGAEPTVTDANLALGRLSPDHLLAGLVRLRPDLAERALAALAARMEDVSVTHLADGIVRLAVARMASATREISVRRGHDPRDFTLVAFGGAGPMHACSLASELGIPRVLIPPSPGNFSALGLLTSDVRHDFVRTRLALQRDLVGGEVERLCGELEAQARAELGAEGFKGDRVRLERSLDMRYAGQAWEVNLKVPAPAPEGAALRQAFDAAYAAIYGHHGAADEEIQLVRVRLSAFGVIDRPRLRSLPDHQDVSRAATRRVYFDGAWHASAVWDRARLGAGARIAGPAIVEEFGATTVVPPGWAGTVDRSGNLVLAAAAGRAGSDDGGERR